jgi:hypothetical protein
VPVSFDAESVIGTDPSHQVVSTAQQMWGSQDEIIPATMSGFIAARSAFFCSFLVEQKSFVLYCFVLFCIVLFVCLFVCLFVVFFFRSFSNVASNTTLVMRCYNASMVPALTSLALNFTLFDAFHSSVPGPTGPNRMYFHAGTSHGAATNLKEYEIIGYPQRSFFKDLDESGKTFGIYFEDFPVTLELRDVRAYPEVCG